MRNFTDLFSKVEWYNARPHLIKRMLSEINSMDGDRLLNTSIDDLARYFEEKYVLDIPVLFTDQIVVDQHETSIDVSHNSLQMIVNRADPENIPGTVVEYEIPFYGDRWAFGIRPTNYSWSLSGSPQAQIGETCLMIEIVGVNLSPTAVRRTFEKALAQIEQNLEALRSDVESYSEQLFARASSAIEARRRKLLADRNLVSSLGFKMKERSGMQRTFVAPEVRRKLSPKMPSASSAPYKPEPIISQDDYDHILETIDSMAQTMERSPSAFVDMTEETLRTQFLVPLNGQYEGQATGETFNYEGKTDILIRSGGRNIFIAECKFWSGQKGLLDTIDQLLGYSSWRDTKVAIILFNRNRDFSRILAAIPDTVKSHSNFKRELSNPTETSFRYCFAHRDDRNREMTLTVMAFDVPK